MGRGRDAGQLDEEQGYSIEKGPNRTAAERGKGSINWKEKKREFFQK